MALIGELVADPVALEQLRRALDAESSDHATAAPPAYTASTLAAALGVSAKTVRNAIARGELRAIKRGARWIVSEDAVREWAAWEPRAAQAWRGERPRGVLAQALARVDEHHAGRRIAAP